MFLEVKEARIEECIGNFVFAFDHILIVFFGKGIVGVGIVVEGVFPVVVCPLVKEEGHVEDDGLVFRVKPVDGLPDFFRQLPVLVPRLQDCRLGKLLLYVRPGFQQDFPVIGEVLVFPVVGEDRQDS